MQKSNREVRRLSEVPDDVTPTKFSHFVLKTARFREMVDWYLTVLKGRVAHENPRVCFMTYDEEHHRVAIVHVPELGQRSNDTCGLDHVSYTYGSLAELLATYKRLKGAGIVPRWSINHGVTTSFYYQDPDGNKVELQYENFPTEKQLNEYFGSAAFARNTLGDEFDPEDMIRQFEEGTAVEELIKSKGTDFGEAQIKVLTEMGLARPPQ